MAPLFSKVDLNKLWHDVQNEETLVCAKFGKDLLNNSKVVGRKKVAHFFDSQCIGTIWKTVIFVSKTVGPSLTRNVKRNPLNRVIDLW